jgi:hypothetical protein
MAMNAKRLYLFGLVMAVLVVGMLAVAGLSQFFRTGGSRATSQTSNAIANVTPTVLPIETPSGSTNDAPNNGSTQQTGAPAIKVNKPSADPNTPACTEQDVRSFVDSAAGHYGKINTVGPAPTITKVEFLKLSSLQQKVEQAKDIKMPPDTLLCEVEISGDFVIANPVHAAQNTTLGHATRVLQIYDAHTGNLLQQSAFNN